MAESSTSQVRSKGEEMMGARDQIDWIMEVGGRQGDQARPGQGGGSPDFCSRRGSALRSRARGPDPRIDELEQLGLDERWLRIARVVGIEAFLKVWRILDEENIDLPAGERDPTRIRVPLFAGWMRLQRNKLVRALAGEGKRPREIKLILQRRLRESISERHINRIISAPPGG